eukprot:gene5335-5870_t
MAEEGYFAIELEHFSLSLSAALPAENTWRLDVEIQNAYDVFNWLTSKQVKYSSEKFKAVLQEGGDSVYVFGFDSLFLRSNYVELTPEALTGLCNANVSVKLVTINEAAASAPTPKVAKGQPPPPVIPQEETLVEVVLPMATLLTSPGNQIIFDQSLEEYQSVDYGLTVKSHASVVSNTSSFLFKSYVDTDLSEYVIGCKLLSWSNAVLSNPAPSWALHAPDVIDPKVKVQPTAADLRNKYIENINKLIDTQSKVASYSLEVGMKEADLSMESTGEEVRRSFPSLALSGGRIQFDSAAARDVPMEEDIRAQSSLWSVQWERSSYIFLHRSLARRLVQTISADGQQAYLPLAIRKVPTPEAVAVEGGEVFATGLVDISSIIDPGRARVTLNISGLVGEGMEGSSLQLVFQASLPLRPLSEMVKLRTALKQQENANNTVVSEQKPAFLAKAPHAAVNRDALQELRDEISRVIERIAQEYVSQYPTSETEKESSPQTAGQLSEDKKTAFLQYLASNGLFHELQERLRPAVVLAIQEKYGPRGRALGKSDVMKDIDSQLVVDREGFEGKAGDIDYESHLQSVLSEIYVFLIKECNLVLNTLFAKTMVQRQWKEIENPARVDDEKETDYQKLSRLLRQAQDAFASQRFNVAETLHMERLQLLDHSASLYAKKSLIHQCYLDYAIYTLQQCCHLVVWKGLDRLRHGQLVGRAREALTVAAQQQPENWTTALLYAILLIESDQAEQGEVVLHQILSQQLHEHGKADYTIRSFEEDFSGYESDQLHPVHPRIYAILASLFYLQEKPLMVRKALQLANRCYEEWIQEQEEAGNATKVNLGSPRRSLVLLLSETTLYLVEHAQYRVGQACLALALESEKAVVEKARLKQKPATSPAHIRYLLKRAQVEASWGFYPVLTSIECLDAARDCPLIAQEEEDRISAHLVAATGCLRSLESVEEGLDHYIQAIRIAMENPSAAPVLPLEVFFSLGQLAQQLGKHEEAIHLLLFGAKHFTSSVICLQLGVSYLRLDKLVEAEEALIEANLLDNRNAEIWAMLTILCLHRSPPRLQEAERCLFQTLRLGLDNATTLRELAMAFISGDKLQLAEDLLRRALVVEASSSSRRMASAHTRKLLADVLAGQNLAAKAVEEYKAVLLDDSADRQTKLSVADKCLALLSSLGRDEELEAVKNIILTLELSSTASAPAAAVVAAEQ